jgi:iron complex outermembrane receptor protein
VLLLFALSACAITAWPVRAASLEQTVEFNIPAGGLPHALILFSQQAHVQVLSSGEQVAKAVTDGLQGRFTVAEGLNRLLRNSGLHFRQDSTGAVTISAGEGAGTDPPARPAGARRAAMREAATDRSGAQDAMLDEVIVTSMFRPQRLIDTPVAVTTVGSQDLENSHVKDFSDLAMLVPNFVSGSNYGYLRNSSMRGISSNQYGFADESSIAMYVDGVFQGRATAGSSVNAVFDVDHVEVVKGPQASLFGHSAIAGAINILRNQPTDEFSQSYDLGFGERNRVVARGVVNIPVSEQLAVRIGADSENQDGYIKNLNGGTLEPLNIKAGRAIARYTGIDGLDATVNVDYEERRQNGSTHSLPSLPDFTADITLVGHQNYANFYIFDTGANLKFTLSPNTTLTSETTFRKVANAYVEKYDALAIVVGGPYSQSSTDRLFQQDFKVLYQSGKTSLVAGASLFDEHLTGFIGNWVDHTFAFTGKPAVGLIPNDYSQAFFEDGYFQGHFSGWSGFVDGTLPVPHVERLTVTATVRYNDDRKNYSMDIPNPAQLPVNAGKPFAGAYYNWGFYTSPPIALTHSWNNLSLRAGTNFELDAENVLYAQYSQGWKAGGIDTFRVANADSSYKPFFGMNATAHGGTPNAYGPEASDNYEIGLKGSVLEHHFSYALDAYYFTYRDLQVPVYQSGGAVIKNIGAADGKGVEADLRYAQGTHWSLFANGAYNFTRIKRYEADPSQVGLPLVQAPKFTSAAGATYSTAAPFGGSTYLGATISQRGAFRTDTATTELVESYVLFNVRIGYVSPTGRYSAKLFADNVTNKFTYSRWEQQTPFVYPVAHRSVIGPPRTIGIDFHADF